MSEEKELSMEEMDETLKNDIIEINETYFNLTNLIDVKNNVFVKWAKETGETVFRRKHKTKAATEYIIFAKRFTLRTKAFKAD